MKLNDMVIYLIIGVVGKMLYDDWKKKQPKTSSTSPTDNSNQIAMGVRG